LIRMDLALPGMDGLTLTRRLKAEPVTQALRVVARTAFAMKGDEQRVLATGCDAYLAKPIDARKPPRPVVGWLQPVSVKS
jgi:CheY-like chemotaxis protein